MSFMNLSTLALERQLGNMLQESRIHILYFSIPDFSFLGVISVVVA